jgi:hypothetical protein
MASRETNPDTTGAAIKVQPGAKYEGQLKNDPRQHFPGVDLQIFGNVISTHLDG